MRKVGILTFHRADNYGSVLQAYALQTYLKKDLSLDTEFLDYIPGKQEEFYRLFVPIRSVQNLVGNLLKLSIARKYQARKSAFEYFRKNYLTIGKQQCRSDRDFKNATRDCSYILTGSDQIWNPQCADFSWNYFLEGITDTVKLSYAASLGGAVLEQKTCKRIAACLNSYKAISVREQFGADLLQKIVGDKKRVEVCVDPTLLLEKADFNKIASKRLIQGEYIFLYSVYHDDELLKTVEALHNKWNLPIITLISRNNSYRVLFHGIKLADAEGPQDFLSYIKYARFVLTNSFHGTVFSILYQKPFCYLGEYQKDPRLYQLLTMTNLTENAIAYQDALKHIQEMKQKRGQDCTCELDRMREKSAEYLRRAFSGYTCQQEK